MLLSSSFVVYLIADLSVRNARLRSELTSLIPSITTLPRTTTWSGWPTFFSALYFMTSSQTTIHPSFHHRLVQSIENKQVHKTKVLQMPSPQVDFGLLEVGKFEFFFKSNLIFFIFFFQIFQGEVSGRLQVQIEKIQGQFPSMTSSYHHHQSGGANFNCNEQDQSSNMIVRVSHSSY